MIDHLLALSGESLPPVTSWNSSTQGLWGRGDHSVAFVPGSTFALFDLTAFLWILTPCHNIQSDPSEAHSSDHRRGEWTFAWDRPLETSYSYKIKRSLWQISSKVRRTNHLPTSEQGRCATDTRPAAASTWVGRCLQHHRDSRQLWS